MKEFVKSQKVTYNLMSFTGFKALLIFDMLTEGPKSFDEISDIIENHPYLREKISTDTMRVYMNSLKRFGCEIKRVKGEDKISRYVITKHPFELNLSDEEIKSVVKVCKILAKQADAKDLIYMYKLFEKIATYTNSEDLINVMRNVLMLKGISIEILEDLIVCCDKKQQIVIRYNSPKSGVKDIEIISDGIEINNGKIYLAGFGFEYMQDAIFEVSRIKQIVEIKDSKTIPQKNTITVTYELETTTKKLELGQDEKLIKIEGNKAVIEITSSNEFLLRQKFLELGSLCRIISPDKFKNDFIETLKDMKAVYCVG